MAPRVWTRRSGKSWNELREEHVADYRRFFRRVELDLGHSTVESLLPRDERIERLKTGKEDTGLEALYFQHAGATC